MININIMHRSNQDGEALLSNLRVHFSCLDSNEIQLNGLTFLNIKIKNPDSPCRLTINPPQAQANCMDRGAMRKILNVNGISMGRPVPEAMTRYYDFLLFDRYILSIKQVTLMAGKKRINYIGEQACMKAAEIARRAVYHLGLDYARIRIALNLHRQYVVIDVNPSPSHVRPREMERLIRRLKKWLDLDGDMLEEKQIKMGADPEFMLFDSRSGKMIAASRFFTRYGRIGYDNLRVPLGHQHPIAEIRPRPSSSPLTLADNVEAALISAAKKAPYHNIKWVAGSQPSRGFALGGHIHFSKVKLNFALLRALDNYLAIPIFLIENPISAVRRRRRYGTLGNYRTKNYGGFEYRTLGSWLVTPQITRGVLCLAKIVACHYLELRENYLLPPAAQKAFYRSDQEYFRPIFNDLWSKVSSTDSYQEYADELRKIHEMIKEGERWDEKQDLRQTWNITARFRRTYHRV